MTKDKAMHEYFEDFMKHAFPDAPVREDDYHYTYLKHRVPDDAILPYLVYTYTESSFDEEDIPISIELWTNSESEAFVNDIVKQFRLYIEDNSEKKCDEGIIWIKPGNPFSQTMETEWKNGPICKYINLLIEYLTRY